jgi:hypothetical protein
VDDHRQPALRGDREHCRHARMAQIEPLRPRMQLHSAGTAGQAPLQLSGRVRVRIDSAEGGEPTFRCLRGREHGVVRLPVAHPFHQREDHRPAPD